MSDLFVLIVSCRFDIRKFLLLGTLRTMLGGGLSIDESTLECLRRFSGIGIKGFSFDVFLQKTKYLLSLVFIRARFGLALIFLADFEGIVEF